MGAVTAHAVFAQCDLAVLSVLFGIVTLQTQVRRRREELIFNRSGVGFMTVTAILFGRRMYELAAKDLVVAFIAGYHWFRFNRVWIVAVDALIFLDS